MCGIQQLRLWKSPHIYCQSMVSSVIAGYCIISIIKKRYERKADFDWCLFNIYICQTLVPGNPAYQLWYCPYLGWHVATGSTFTSESSCKMLHFDIELYSVSLIMKGPLKLKKNHQQYTSFLPNIYYVAGTYAFIVLTKLELHTFI